MYLIGIELFFKSMSMLYRIELNFETVVVSIWIILIFLLLGLFPSSGVAGMVWYSILPLCPVQCVLLFLPHTFPISFIRVFQSGAWSVLLSDPFLVLVHSTLVLASSYHSHSASCLGFSLLPCVCARQQCCPYHRSVYLPI